MEKMKLISNYSIKVSNIPDGEDFPFDLYFDDIEKVERIKDLSKLKNIEKEYESMCDLVDYYQYFPEKTMSVFNKKKCFDFYTQGKIKLEEKLKKCSEIIKNEAYIVFQSQSIANKYKKLSQIKMNSIRIKIETASEPSDIEQNYLSPMMRSIRILAVNMVLLFIVIYYASPLVCFLFSRSQAFMSALMNVLEYLPFILPKKISQNYFSLTSNFIFQYHSTLFLVFLGYIIPGWIIPCKYF
jgi:hypothetical protein